MVTENIDTPVMIKMINTSSKTISFVPYRENLIHSINAGDELDFEVLNSGEALYYLEQVTSGLSISQQTVDTGKDFLTYSLPNQVGSSIINAATGTVNLSVAGSLSNLAATFTISNDATIKVGSKVQVSGTTKNNFTSAVVYTITSEDGIVKTWTVTATLATYDLAVTAPNATVSVTVGGQAITPGSDALTYGDNIVITYSAESGYQIDTAKLNAEDITSGDTVIVSEDESIVLTTSVSGS